MLNTATATASLTRKQLKTIEHATDRAFYANCAGVQIPVMELGTITKAGREAGARGEDIESAVKAAIDKFRPAYSPPIDYCPCGHRATDTIVGADATAIGHYCRPCADARQAAKSTAA